MKPIIAERASCKASLKGEIILKNAKGEFRAFAKKALYGHLRSLRR